MFYVRVKNKIYEKKTLRVAISFAKYCHFRETLGSYYIATGSDIEDIESAEEQARKEGFDLDTYSTDEEARKSLEEG